jgi:predicted transcriptional regulator
MRMTDMRKKVKQYIDEADDDTVKMVYSMLEADREEDWWDYLPKEIQESILRGEKELDEGKGIPHEEVMKKYKKWLTK